MKNILNITITNLKQYRIYLKQKNYHLPVDLRSELRTLAISVTLDNKLTRVQPYFKMLINVYPQNIYQATFLKFKNLIYNFVNINSWLNWIDLIDRS